MLFYALSHILSLFHNFYLLTICPIHTISNKYQTIKQTLLIHITHKIHILHTTQTIQILSQFLLQILAILINKIISKPTHFNLKALDLCKYHQTDQTKISIWITTRPNFKNINITCSVLLMSHGIDVGKLENVGIAQVMNV